MNISITKTQAPKAKPSFENLPFGRLFTDHMFIMDYSRDKGWHSPQIVPYAPLEMDPATAVFHYGQAMFEGLKAYRTKGGEILLFRPEKNFARVNVSNERLAIPAIDEDFALEALKALINIDRDWVPDSDGASLYIRPFIIATDPCLGVKASDTYKFMIIMSPSGRYYASGLNPVAIYVEDVYVRAVKGGMGYTKTSGNYAASIKAQEIAHERGYSQVLWLDGVERKYIEEVGAMNIFFIIGDEVVTPELSGSILSGITRMSVIELLGNRGVKVSERRLSIEEVYEAYKSGALRECFGTGTAAVISPVGELLWEGHKMVINDGKIVDTTQMIYDTLTGIQTGVLADEFGWTVRVG